jgi:hypothetical protein
VFHVELRQFPHVARAFNLSAEELNARIVSPWVAGQPVELEDRRWTPDRARLTIYQARELAGEEIGMGRGWGTVSRDGEEVTVQLLSGAQQRQDSSLEELKRELERAAAEAPLPLSRTLELAGEPTWRVSERLAQAEQAVWELLHEERLELLEDGRPAGRDRWQPVILTPASWGPDGGVAVRLAVAGRPRAGPG